MLGLAIVIVMVTFLAFPLWCMAGAAGATAADRRSTGPAGREAHRDADR